jgi:hypothetical protein
VKTLEAFEFIAYSFEKFSIEYSEEIKKYKAPKEISQFK